MIVPNFPNGRCRFAGFGVLDWLQSKPAHWSVRRAKYFFREIDVRSKTGDEELLSVSHVTGVTPRSEKTITMFEAESYVGSKLCWPGDLVINTMWAWMAALGISNYHGIVSPSYSVYRLIDREAFNPRFLDFLLRTPQYAAEYMCRSTGIRDSRLRLYPEEFLKVPLLYAPRPEQDAIVSFLGQKLAEIDEFIANKRQLMDFARERFAVELDMLTTGANLANAVQLQKSDGPLVKKPSGWDMLRLRHVCRFGTGDKDTVDAQPSGQYPFFVRSQTVERIHTYSYDGEAVLTAGDGAGVGKVFHYASGRFDYHQRVYRFSCFRRVSGRFFYHYLRANLWKEVFRGNAKSTVDSLRRPMLADFPILVPPPNEQARIVRQADAAERLLAKTVERTEREIALMNELRTSLIAEAVTGKIDVRRKP